MSFRTYFLVLLILLLLHSLANPFDKLRKGFCLGFGLGIAPYAGYSVDYHCWYDNSEGTLSASDVSAAVNFLIGYGWNDKNILVVEFQFTSIPEEDPPCPEPSWSFHLYIGPEPTVEQVYYGPVWYHFFSSSRKGPFSLFGLGLAFHDQPDETEPGLGIIFGGGHEIGRGWNISARYFRGNSYNDYGGPQYRLKSLSFLLTKVWY